MTAFKAFAWFARNPIARSPQPPLAAIRIMLSEIELKMQVTGYEPITVKCIVWPPSAFAKRYGNDWLGLISIEAAPCAENGARTYRPLASWFQWQHPQWALAGAEVPSISRATEPKQLPLIRSATIEVRA